MKELQPFLILYSISRPWYRSSIWARKMLLTLPFLRLWKVVLVSYWQNTMLFSFFSFQITETIGLYKVSIYCLSLTTHVLCKNMIEFSFCVMWRLFCVHILWGNFHHSLQLFTAKTLETPHCSLVISVCLFFVGDDMIDINCIDIFGRHCPNLSQSGIT